MLQCPSGEERLLQLEHSALSSADATRHTHITSSQHVRPCCPPPPQPGQMSASTTPRLPPSCHPRPPHKLPPHEPLIPGQSQHLLPDRPPQFSIVPDICGPLLLLPLPSPSHSSKATTSCHTNTELQLTPQRHRHHHKRHSLPAVGGTAPGAAPPGPASPLGQV